MGRTNVRDNPCDRLNVVGTHFQGVPNFALFLGRLGEPSLPMSATAQKSRGLHPAVDLSRRLGRDRSLIARSDLRNSTLGSEINGETSEPVSAFVMLACYRCQSGPTMRIGCGLQRGTA